MDLKDRFVYECKLVRVIDGDTIDVEVDLGFKIYHIIRLRFARIDAPEPRGITKIAGKESAKALTELITGTQPSLLFIQTEKTGKYGRYIAEVWIPSQNAGIDLDNAYTDTFNGEIWINANDYLVLNNFAKYATQER